jgi:hypothetical protein
MTYSTGMMFNRPTLKTAKPAPTKECSTCGGVECFERPRFFAGQLLTDKDLEAAQQYVIDKNKLHNRYLVGTGTVCGLAVRCDPCCSGSVVVEPGYAIDCCGNDIVLCDVEKVDILDLIIQQHPGTVDCCDRKIRSSSVKDDQVREYCLFLHYAEEPACPVTALIRDNGCGNTRCEPSRMRESFRFSLKEKSSDKTRPQLIPDESFLGQVLECFQVLREAQAAIKTGARAESKYDTTDANAAASTAAFTSVFYQFRKLVLEFYQREPEIRCTLPEKVAEIEAQFQSGGDEAQYRATLLLLGLAAQLLLDCFCNALLAPCPDCKEEVGVEIACITLRGNKIEKICNTVRKQLITGPSLQYWLQPLFAGLKQLMDLLCCQLDLVKLLDDRLPQPQEPIG